MDAMRWLVDGYNVIRRAPDLAGLERKGLEAARTALCRRLAGVASASGDTFAVVFDGAGAGGSGLGAAGVRVLFSSARETADRVIARLARDGGAVVSSDREVREAARRAGAVSVTAEEFLARLGRAPAAAQGAEDTAPDKDDEADAAPRGPRKGNPRRLPKKTRAKTRALDRLR
jgi:predicted RNA-binding protein with PIN domain